MDDTSTLDIDSVAELARNPTGARTRHLEWDPAIGPTAIGFAAESEPLVIDWSGAGTLDLIVTAGSEHASRRAYLFRPVATDGENDAPYDAGERLDALDGLRCVCAVRNGRESRFDLIGLAVGGFVWLPNAGTASVPAFRERKCLGIPADLGLGPCRIVQVSAVDWDGDGCDDLLIGVDDLTDYWADQEHVPTSQQRGFNQKAGHPGYDQHGLWRGRPPVGRLFWLKSRGVPGMPEFELQPELVGDTHALDVGMHPAPLGVAWERPRGLQLLLTDRRGLVRVFRNFGDQRPPVLMEPRTLLCGGAQFVLPEDRTVLTARDLDQDLRDELVYGTADGRVFAVHATSTRGEVHTPRAVPHRSNRVWLGGGAVVAAGDLDDDGGLDLVSGVATGRLWLCKDGGAATAHRYQAPVPIEAGGAPFQLLPGPDGLLDGPVRPSLGYACPALVDWSGHGRLDLLLGGAGGEVILLRNDGARNDPRFGSAVPIRCQGAPVFTPPRVRPAAADWQGNGLVDLLALDLQGFLCLYPRAGKYEVGSPVPLVDRLGRTLRLDGGFGLSGRCSLWAGPWCGTARVDLLVGLPRANRHVVAAITGLAFDSLDEIPSVVLLENLGHNTVCPRPIYHRDGRPLVLGEGGCSPNGVPAPDGNGLDLLVGDDTGSVVWLARGELKW